MGLGIAGTSAPFVSIGNNGERIITPFGPMIHQSFLSDEEVDIFLREGERIPMSEEDYNFKMFNKNFTDSVAPLILGRAESFIVNASKIFNIGLPSPESLYIDYMWINYQKQYDTVPLHTHFTLLQFVIYCDVPQRIFEETGRHNPMLPGRLSLNYGEEITSFSNQTYLITPEKNMMIIFPGKLHHTVYPFYSDDTRISVAGAIATTEQQKL